MGPKYNENFQLNPNDIELIEEALRKVLESLTHDTMNAFNDPQLAAENLHVGQQTKIKKINQVLGKLHNKKIFYSQTHRKKGMPLG